MAYTTIDKPTDYFNTKLYTGNASTNNITGLNFQPDWVWLKSRSFAQNHENYDSVRGATKRLYNNLTNAEDTNSTGLTSFNSDGFTLGSSNSVNKSGDTFVSWNWLASGSTASNTDGSITSTVSANTTAGFSIVSYTGTGSNATVGHGLNQALDMVIVKNRDDVVGWQAWHNAFNGDELIKLDSNSAKSTSSTRWNSTIPTSSVFSVGTSNGTNGSSDDMIAYCFAEKKGYSKFGSYTGNGSTDGPFIYTGFKPAFLIVKAYSHAQDWEIFDNKRSTFNPLEKNLAANSNSSEQTDLDMDFLSNGFKVRIVDDSVNNSSYSYIYMAFAESPFVTSTGIPTTAR